jgi:hypothetical protein
VLRAFHQHALRALRIEAAAAARAEATDEWRDTRRSAWEARRRHLEMRREAFNEVAKPLEPYIAVFVLFATPAFVMSTPFCQNHSGASSAETASVSSVASSTDFTYGTCDVWCEFLLAFRSLGSVAVYLAPRERRCEVVAVGATWSKLCTRVFGGRLRCSVRTNEPMHGRIEEHYEMFGLAQEPPANQDMNADGAAVGDDNAAVADGVVAHPRVRHDPGATARRWCIR